MLALRAGTTLQELWYLPLPQLMILQHTVGYIEVIEQAKMARAIQAALTKEAAEGLSKDLQRAHRGNERRPLPTKDGAILVEESTMAAIDKRMSRGKKHTVTVSRAEADRMFKPFSAEEIAAIERYG